MSNVLVNLRNLSTGYLTGVQRYAAELVERIPQLEPIVSKLEGLRGHAWEQAVLPTLLHGRLLWSPANTGPLVVEKQVVTIHDLSVVDRPEGFSPGFREFYRFLLPRLARRVRAVITDSAFTRERLIEWARIPLSKCLWGKCDDENSHGQSYTSGKLWSGRLYC